MVYIGQILFSGFYRGLKSPYVNFIAPSWTANNTMRNNEPYVHLPIGIRKHVPSV